MSRSTYPELRAGLKALGWDQCRIDEYVATVDGRRDRGIDALLGARPSNIDVDLESTYGYSRRETQSAEYITIPAALLEEAIVSMPGGDAHALLSRALEKGVRS